MFIPKVFQESAAFLERRLQLQLSSIFNKVRAKLPVIPHSKSEPYRPCKIKVIGADGEKRLFLGFRPFTVKWQGCL